MNPSNSNVAIVVVSACVGALTAGIATFGSNQMLGFLRRRRIVKARVGVALFRLVNMYGMLDTIREALEKQSYPPDWTDDYIWDFQKNKISSNKNLAFDPVARTEYDNAVRLLAEKNPILAAQIAHHAKVVDMMIVMNDKASALRFLRGQLEVQEKVVEILASMHGHKTEAQLAQHLAQHKSDLSRIEERQKNELNRNE